MKIVNTLGGDKKYIFAVFSDKDERRVMGIIDQLSDIGVNVRYDNGTNDCIEPLNVCNAVLLFVSNNIIGAHNCRSRLNNAVIAQKPVVAVYLEKTHLTPTMELQLSSASSVLLWETDEKELFEILLNNEFVKECSQQDVLCGDNEPYATDDSSFVLIREKTGEKISIPRAGLRLGRRRSLCDYTVEGNKTLSRLHATFGVNNDRCTVTDNDSLNGVYINGVRLPANACAELKENDELRLGSERFILSKDTREINK